MRENFWLYLLAMAGVTYLIRAVPLLLCRRQIRQRFVLSFLHYVPYAVLTVMTVPACFYATGHWATAAVGVAVALVLSYRRSGLLTVAFGAVGGVLLAELCLTWLAPLLG